MAKAGLMGFWTTRDPKTKVGHNEHQKPICGALIYQKSYPGDNRVVAGESSRPPYTRTNLGAFRNLSKNRQV